MSLIGTNTRQDLALPSNWDLETLNAYKLGSDNLTFDLYIQEAARALTLLNARMLQEDHYSGLFSLTEEPTVEYQVGSNGGIQEMSELSVPDPSRGATSGHTLPLIRYTRAIGWTVLAIKDARRSKLDADLDAALNDIRNGWQQKLLQRLFKMESERVGATSTASVPFADGGTADSAYIPPAYQGKAFDATHDHYTRVATLNDAAVSAALLNLKEHGHASPYNIVAAELDASTWTGLTGWHGPNYGEILWRNTDRANLPDNQMFSGYVETDNGVGMVWLTPRVPTGYFGSYKTYGVTDQRNPLRVRYNPADGFGWVFVPGNWVNSPTLLAVPMSQYGIGVGQDRTNGVFVKIAASGDYTTPTIS